MSLLIRSLFAATLAVSASTALAATQDNARPVGPTLGDIARQAEQQGPAIQLPAAGNLPTIGDVAKQQEAQAKAAAAAAANSGCTRPKVPGKLPDGKTATEQEMRDAQIAVKAYVSQSEAFNACLDKLVKASLDRITAREYLALIQQYDLTYSAMQIFAERFNVQLRAYRARTGDTGNSQ
ncbi:hypothetical protein CHU95_06150 [Niveispirillum lacus]|uniref:DUF4168 domain-containing protein n=1 Tax=Niveispirillum lacus TaxID=1981099 RepID=A0A255Z336_9PROT|nr:hypothetical protein [Niveispirillum lacus]OYQ35849.1 hypothetical protein CHU95_06150 [Niveispirillum lacus]